MGVTVSFLICFSILASQTQGSNKPRYQHCCGLICNRAKDIPSSNMAPKPAHQMETSHALGNNKIPKERNTPTTPPLRVPVYAVVVRKDVRDLSDIEWYRFARAVERMMKNKKGAGTSPYYDIAMWYKPNKDKNNHCGTESFPNFNRLLVKAFENELQNADIKNGNNGNISLPYWDWLIPEYNDTVTNTSVVLPPRIRDVNDINLYLHKSKNTTKCI